MFHLSVGNEKHFVAFCSPICLAGSKNTPLFIFRGHEDEGEPNKLYRITSLQNSVDTLGEPKSLGYSAFWNTMLSHNGCEFYVMRADTSFTDAVDLVLADGTYPQLNYLKQVYDEDTQNILKNL